MAADCGSVAGPHALICSHRRHLRAGRRLHLKVNSTTRTQSLSDGFWRGKDKVLLPEYVKTNCNKDI